VKNPGTESNPPGFSHMFFGREIA